jgi:hypothetical protein
LGEQLLLASITRSAPVVRKTQAWIMSPWALVPVMLSAHTAASANLWRTMIFSIEAPPCCLYSHAGFYRDKDARKALVYSAPIKVQHSHGTDTPDRVRGMSASL